MCNSKSDQSLFSISYFSKSEFFAAHAPEEIPDWFECQEIPRPPYPKFPELTPEQSDKVNKWKCDPCYDLEDEFLKYVQTKYEAYYQQLKKVEKENVKIRYFQWRKYYGQMMAAAFDTPE